MGAFTQMRRSWMKRAEFGTTKTKWGCPEKTPNGWNCWGKTEDVEHVGQLDKRRVEEIRSLIAAIQPEEVKRGPGQYIGLRS